MCLVGGAREDLVERRSSTIIRDVPLRIAAKPKPAKSDDQEGVGIEIAADRVRRFMCLFITAQTHGARSLSNIAQLAPRGGIIDAELPSDHADHGA